MKADRGLVIARMVELAGVSRASFYRYDEDAAVRPDRDMDLRDAIQRIALEWPSYGRPRITAALRQTGGVINHKVVQRLMSKMDLKSRVRVKKYRSYRGEQGAVAPNELKRNCRGQVISDTPIGHVMR